MKQVMLALVAVSLAACATTPKAPAFEPAGMYDFTTEFQGTSIAGTLMLRRTEQGLTGTFATPLTGEVAFDAARMEGRTMRLTARLPDGALEMNLDFAEDYRFSGQWTLAGGMGGVLNGTRRPTSR